MIARLHFFLSIYYMLKYSCGECIHVKGELGAGENSSIPVRLSENSTRNINITFSVTFPTETCCPVLHFRAVDDESKSKLSSSSPRCFEESPKLVPIKHYVTLKDNYANCTHSNNGSMTTCTENRAFSYMEPRFFFVRFGYQCGEMHVEGLSGVQYDFCVDDTINIECDTLQHDEECNINESLKVSFPNVFGHRNQRDVNDNHRRFDVLIEHNEKCYQHTRMFLCQSLYSECRTNGPNRFTSSGNSTTPARALQQASYTAPCRKMCEELFLGCNDSDLLVTVDCENYPDGLPPSAPCTYVEVQCPLPMNISNGRLIYTGNRLNDNATYTCDEGFGSGNSTVLTCLPSGNWTTPTPTCIKKGLSYYRTAIIIGCVVAVVVIVSAVVTLGLCRKYFVKRTPVNDIAIQVHRRNIDSVFICCSSQNIDDARAFLNELENRHPRCRFFTYHDHFLPGERIVDCIVTSVWEDSSAVIIYLTQDFLESNWCLHEFEEAYRRHEEHHDYPLIIVLHENAVPGFRNVPEHVQKYLTDHIYLSLEDDLLWQKLTPALGQ